MNHKNVGLYWEALVYGVQSVFRHIGFFSLLFFVCACISSLSIELINYVFASDAYMIQEWWFFVSGSFLFLSAQFDLILTILNSHYGVIGLFFLLLLLHITVFIGYHTVLLRLYDTGMRSLRALIPYLKSVFHYLFAITTVGIPLLILFGWAGDYIAIWWVQPVKELVDTRLWMSLAVCASGVYILVRVSFFLYPLFDKRVGFVSALQVSWGLTQSHTMQLLLFLSFGHGVIALSEWIGCNILQAHIGFLGLRFFIVMIHFFVVTSIKSAYVFLYRRLPGVR